MILCFGTFASVLNRCKQGLSQDKFIPRIVWVVDSKNRCLGDGLDYEISGDDLETMEMLGNPSVVSKLLSCKQSLNLRTTSRPSLEIVAERFNAKVVPFIDEDKVAKAVLALLRIISRMILLGLCVERALGNIWECIERNCYSRLHSMSLISLRGFYCIRLMLIIEKVIRMLKR